MRWLATAVQKPSKCEFVTEHFDKMKKWHH